MGGCSTGISCLLAVPQNGRKLDFARKDAKLAIFKMHELIQRCEELYSRVPVSLLNPEGKILIFYGSFGVTANFAMVPKFEETAKKSTRRLVKWVVLVSSAGNSG